jgi:4a-hydroxytetrahydrobiopterin dehydratase
MQRPGILAKLSGWAKAINNYPGWFNAWNHVEVTLSTHDTGSLTELDIELAGFMGTVAG